MGQYNLKGKTVTKNDTRKPGSSPQLPSGEKPLPKTTLLSPGRVRSCTVTINDTFNHSCPPGENRPLYLGFLSYIYDLCLIFRICV